MNNKVKTFFSDAALKLSELCEKIDNSEEIDEILLEEFNKANLTLSESIDRRKYIYSEAENKIKLAKEYKRSLDISIKRLEKVKDRIEINTRNMMEIKPNIPYQDTLGNKLFIKKNATKKLEILYPNLIQSKSIEVLNYNEDMPPEYIKHVSFLCLDKERLKEDLEAGKELHWAKLTQGTHLKGLKI